MSRPARSAAAFLVGMSLVLPICPRALASVKYDVPIDWIRIETRGDYEEAYETSLDASKRLFVLVRTVDASGASAAEWADEESSRMKREGAKTGPPLPQVFGTVRWTYVDWRSESSGEGGRRYFAGATGSVVEVSLLGKEDVFKTSDASQFDAFFASFSF